MNTKKQTEKKEISFDYRIKDCMTIGDIIKLKERLK